MRSDTYETGVEMKEGPSFRRITTRRRPHADNCAARHSLPRRQQPPAGTQLHRRRPAEVAGAVARHPRRRRNRRQSRRYPPRPTRQPLPLAGEAGRARAARPRTRLPTPAQQPQAPARPRPRRGRPRLAGEAALLRQGQDCRRVAQGRLGRLRLDGRAHPRRREEARNPPRAPATRRPPPQPPPQAPLRRPQAQRLPARPPWRPRPSRHARRPPAPRRGPQAFHGAGRRLTLRRLAGGDASDLRERRAIPRRHRCAHALSGQGYPGGRGLRVPRGVRGGLP